MTNPCFEAVDDDVAQRLAKPSPLLFAIFEKYHAELQAAFLRAATLQDENTMDKAKLLKRKQKQNAVHRTKSFKKPAQSTTVDKALQVTINLTEWLEFLELHKLIGGELTIREAQYVFVQVNLDDELYVQQEAGNTSSEIVYDEFIECVCRIALATAGVAMDAFEATDDGKFEKFLDDYLVQTFLPALHAARNAK